VLFFASWVLYATCGDVRAALTPGRVWKLISLDPKGYLTTLLASVAIIAAGSVSALLVVIIPWVGFAAFSAISFNYSKYYQDTLGRAS